jgi:hypothetical protein
MYAKVQNYQGPRSLPTVPWAVAPSSIDTLLAPGTVVTSLGQGVGGATWPSDNRILYIPLRVKGRVVARKLWYASSSTAGAANVDLGLYNRAGTRLVHSGSTAHVVSNDEHVLGISDTLLAPDLYYLGMWCDSALGNFTRLGTSGIADPILAALGVRSEAGGAGALPATATWSIAQDLTFYPVVGIFTVTQNT